VKYWVYKESRILGPFDKEGVSGLPGLDSGTLVCAGDPAGSSWRPAGEHEGLNVLSASSGPADDLSSTIGLLDQLEIESAGLIDGDDMAGSFAEDLFQDASLKKGFADVLSARSPSEDAEARRARDKIVELTAQLETMYRHVSELEAGQTDLARRLAERELELRVRAAAAPPAQPSARRGGEGCRRRLPASRGAPRSSRRFRPAPAEWPEAPAQAAGGFPSFPGAALTPLKAATPLPAEVQPMPPAVFPPAVELPPIPAAAALPDIPPLVSAGPSDAVSELPPPPPSPLPPPPSRPLPAPAILSFKPKSFRSCRRSSLKISAPPKPDGRRANPPWNSRSTDRRGASPPAVTPEPVVLYGPRARPVTEPRRS
jgi:hypothetical protein